MAFENLLRHLENRDRIARARQEYRSALRTADRPIPEDLELNGGR